VFRLALFSFFFFLFSTIALAQDSIPEQKDLTEDAELKFQQYFFKALSQKSIGNYQKAIENLENCNQLVPNDVAVFFEFSKNFLSINNTLLAKEYIKRALAKDENNVWMLKHLVKIHQKERNFEKAIEVQQKVIESHPKEREFLVRLYLYNRQEQEAVSLMNVLESENVLSSHLKRLRKNLQNKNNPKKPSVKKVNDVNGLINQFKNDKSYTILKQILEKLKNNPSELLKYSEEGIALFPAQPYVYLVKAKTLNSLKNHKKALTTLQNGIDFVIEDAMEADFYKEIAKAYKGLGNVKEENKYQQKVKKLKS
jgi:tetratricopeptide (TPR) repeat protein